MYLLKIIIMENVKTQNDIRIFDIELIITLLYYC